MLKNKDKIGIVILAAGKGTRMESDSPKVMLELRDKPMVEYVVEKVEELGIKPVLVVSDDDVIKNYFGKRVNCVVQEPQSGTGHAVMSAKEFLQGKVKDVAVLYGDMPFITSQSIKKLVEEHQKSRSKLTMLTIIVPNYEGDNKYFYDFGRVIRSENGRIKKIVEWRDADEGELKIKELNTSFYCYQADWLWENLKKLENKNVQEEYYLTDLVEIAVESGEEISSIQIDSKEAIGINTLEHLQQYNNITV